MITQPDLVGRRLRPQGRAPGRAAAGRVCLERSCSTLLSIYNRHDMCFRHSPIRLPRTRTR